MKQLRFIFCVFILFTFFVVSAHAEVDIYNNPLESQGNANTGFVKKDTTDYMGLSLFVNGGFIYDSNIVSKIRSVPGNTMGNFYTGTLSYRPQYSAYNFEFRYQAMSTPYTGMQGFNTTNFFVTHSDIMFLAKFRPKSSGTSAWKNFYIGFGYFTHERLIDRVISPKTFINQNTSGPVIAVGNTAAISSKFNYDVSLYVKLPNAISEPKQATTGEYQSGYGGEINLSIIYPYTELLDISLGAGMQMSTLIFRGSGTRGVTTAVESESIITVPLEFRFKF